MSSVEVAFSHPSLLGECPLWSPGEGLLYWIDIDSCQIHRFDPAAGSDEVRTISGRPGSMVLTSESEVFLVAMENELVWFWWETERIETFVSLEQANTGNRLNDGRTDPAGRYVVGSMWADTSEGRSTGSLYSVSGNGTAITVGENIGVSNGLAFDAELGRAYFADTFTKRVVCWDYDTTTAERTNERVFWDYRGTPGLPDGACVDAEGFYWSASVHGWAVIRVAPDGTLDRRIELPVEKPSMPAFGGPDLATLFITSIGAGGGRPSKPGRKDVVPGSLLAVDPGVGGLPETPFAGTVPDK